jgi:hypothetical protein
MPAPQSPIGTAEGEGMARVFIGVDPHKQSATIEVIDHHETVLGTDRFGTDRAGYAAMVRHVAAWPDRGWAVEGSNGAGQAVCPGPVVRHRPQPQDRRS